MKHIPMGRRKKTTRPSGGGSTAGGRQPPLPRTPAIDLFIDRSLHALFDAVVEEPIPEEWLRLIEDDRPK